MFFKVLSWMIDTVLVFGLILRTLISDKKLLEFETDYIGSSELASWINRTMIERTNVYLLHDLEDGCD